MKAQKLKMSPFFLLQNLTNYAISHLGAPALTLGTDLYYLAQPSRSWSYFRDGSWSPDYQMLKPKSEQRQKRPTIRNTLVLRSYAKPHLVKAKHT